MSKGVVCGCHECHPELEDPGELEPRMFETNWAKLVKYFAGDRPICNCGNAFADRCDASSCGAGQIQTREDIAREVVELLALDERTPEESVEFGYPCQSEQCSPCRGTVRKTVIPFYRTRIRGHFYEVKGAVIGVCDHCGAHHFASSETKRWEQLFNEAVESLHDDIPF